MNPITAYLALLDGAFGNLYSLGVTLTKTTPLILTGLSVAFAFRCNLLNIGAEGQLYAGAWPPSLVGIYVRGLPSFLHIPLCLLSGFLAGAFWAGSQAIFARPGDQRDHHDDHAEFRRHLFRELFGPGPHCGAARVLPPDGSNRALGPASHSPGEHGPFGRGPPGGGVRHDSFLPDLENPLRPGAQGGRPGAGNGPVRRDFRAAVRLRGHGNQRGAGGSGGRDRRSRGGNTGFWISSPRDMGSTGSPWPSWAVRIHRRDFRRLSLRGASGGREPDAAADRASDLPGDGHSGNGHSVHAGRGGPRVAAGRKQ